MASSALSHTLDDLLDAVNDEVGGREFSDSEKALVENAEAVLEEYKSAGAGDAPRLADQVRQQLALLVQHINQEYPNLVGMRELRDAVDLLSNPHLPASDVATPREPALTPNEPGPVPPSPLAPGEGSVEYLDRGTNPALEGVDHPRGFAALDEEEKKVEAKKAGRPRKEDK